MTSPVRPDWSPRERRSRGSPERRAGTLPYPGTTSRGRRIIGDSPSAVNHGFCAAHARPTERRSDRRGNPPRARVLMEWLTNNGAFYHRECATWTASAASGKCASCGKPGGDCPSRLLAYGRASPHRAQRGCRMLVEGWSENSSRPWSLEPARRWSLPPIPRRRQDLGEARFGRALDVTEGARMTTGRHLLQCFARLTVLSPLSRTVSWSISVRGGSPRGIGSSTRAVRTFALY